MELATGDLVLNAVEVGSDRVYAGRVTDEDDLVSQKFGLQM